jgi:hypothetical protein
MISVRSFPSPTLVALALALTVSLGSGFARGAEEVSAENKAAARDLATQGIRLAQDGKCDEAIPKLVRAEKLYHAPTILTWIGQCQIQLGRLVEGTETLNRVVREDIDDNSPEAYLAAQGKAKGLIAEAQPKIARLTIEVEPEGIEGLHVTVNERPIAAALVGAPRPSDPGTQTVSVSAPGYKTATQEIELSDGGEDTLSFTLEVDPNAEAAPAKGGTSAGGSEAGPQKKSTNWVGWTVVGVGGAFLAAGGVTGFLAMKKEGDLSDNCPVKDNCSSEYDSDLKSARTNATLSTIFMGVGGAAAATGVVLLLTGNPGKKDVGSRRLTPMVGLGSVALSGTF